MSKVNLEQLYHQRYTGDMKFLTSYPGTHSLVYPLLLVDLPGTRVLDVGCGAGRLSLMCARDAAHVDGIDFEPKAVALAQTMAELCGIQNVSFLVESAENLAPSCKYDFVLLIGTLEHIIEPARLLKKLTEMLTSNGKMVIVCPGFINFRGYIWMALQSLFDFPMSPSDIWQIYVHHIREWAEMCDLSVERQVGLYFNWGWTDKAVQDMKQRVRFAVRDKRQDEPSWQEILVDFEAFDAYLSSQLEYHHSFLHALMAEKVLIETPARGLQITIPTDGIDPDFLGEAARYLADGPMWYADRPPYSYMGAETLWVLSKRRPAC